MNQNMNHNINQHMKSIYIPRMDVRHDENYVKIVLQNNYKFGVVNRVDFTTINKKPGFSENMTNNFKSAFSEAKYYNWLCYVKLK